MNNFSKLNDSKINYKIKKKINDVISHGQFILGPEIKELEKKLERFTCTNYCLTVSSGTDALLISLMALGIKKGDEIITSPFSWISSVETIASLGAKVVFVDINSKTYNIDEDKISKSITNKTKAIMAVSIFGQCSNMDKINRIAKAHKIPVIEDAAQSFGAEYKNKKSCGLSTIGCTSFFPTKPLGAFGDAGACFTNDKKLFERMLSIRNHGQKIYRYNYEYLGINGRMDTIQAAILIEKLRNFKSVIKKRNQIGKYYNKLLSKYRYIKTPEIAKHNSSVYAQYTIQIKNRDYIKKKLFDLGIPTFIFYPYPLSKVKYLKNTNVHLPVVTKVCKNVLSLPMNSYLTKADQKLIVESLVNVCQKIEKK